MSNNVNDNPKAMSWAKKNLPLLLYGALALMISTLFIKCVALKPAADMANIEHQVLPKLPEKLPLDSIRCNTDLLKDTVVYISDYKARVAMVDSLYSDMYRLSERYREESAQLVDRTGAWMGFWITLICMLTGFFAFLQYSNMQNEINNLREYKTDIDKRIDDKVKDFEKKIKSSKDELSANKRANTVSALAQCIMVLPDIEMSNDLPKSKELICSFHKMLVENFDAFCQLLLKFEGQEEIDMEQIRIVLSMIRNSLSRVQAVMTNPANAIALYEASTVVNDCIEKCLTGEINKSNILDNLNNVNGKLLSVNAKLCNAAVV